MTTFKANLLMHACVLVWGFTAILGKFITLTALDLVLWRMALTSAFLFFMARAWQSLRQFSVGDWPLLLATGLLIALHWLAFYGAVKVSNASIGVLTIAFAPIFSALFTPILSKEGFSLKNLLLSMSILPGMALVVGGVDTHFRMGIVLGAISAALIAIFSLLNKKLVNKYSILPLSFMQIAIGGLMLAPVALLSTGKINMPQPHDWPWLMVFALFCTAIPFAVSSFALRYISAFSAQFAVNLEPIYGIVFAAWLLNEKAQLTTTFYLGASLIIAAVFAQAMLDRKTSA